MKKTSAWRRRFVATMTLTAMAGGCSAIEDYSGSGPLGPNGPHFYGGVKTFASSEGTTKKAYASIFKGLSNNTGPWQNCPNPQISGGSPDGCGMACGIMAGIVFAPARVDLAGSFVLDTLSLPWTLAKDEPAAPGHEN